MCFYVSLDHFNPVLLAFVVLGVISSVASQEIGWEGVTYSVSSGT